MSADLARIFLAALELHRAGNLAAAENGYRAVLGRDPDHVGALAELGRLAFQRGRADVAVALLGRAVDLAPAEPDFRNNLAIAQSQVGQVGAAQANNLLNLVYNPALAMALINLGNVMRDRGRLAGAIRLGRRALVVEPGNWAAWNNLGSALHQATDDTGAIAAYRAALALHDLPAVRHNLSHALLAQGQMEEGWREYEWRAHAPEHAPTWPRFAQPRWQGEAAPGRTLLIHAEQGLGDMLQFCRYVPLVARRGLKIVLQVQAPLVRLMQRLGDDITVVARGASLPPFDLHCPMLSLPLIFGTTLQSVPADVPYLDPYPNDVEARARQMAGDKRPKVGLSWAGNPQLPADVRRSLPADRLATLLARTDMSFYSLQYGAAAPDGMVELPGDIRDFADTAAVVANLDLVIAVDSAIAHLAGALGKPVWLLNRFDSEWRWLRGREDSPWYPTLRQFRQAAPGDWDGVMARVDAALDEFSRAGHG